MESYENTTNEPAENLVNAGKLLKNYKEKNKINKKLNDKKIY